MCSHFITELFVTIIFHPIVLLLSLYFILLYNLLFQINNVFQHLVGTFVKYSSTFYLTTGKAPGEITQVKNLYDKKQCVQNNLPEQDWYHTERNFKINHRMNRFITLQMFIVQDLLRRRRILFVNYNILNSKN